MPPEISEEELKAFNDSKSMIDDLNSQLGKVKGKNDELLGEKKKAQAAQTEADEKAELAKREKLKDNGDFEKLLELRGQELKSATDELEKQRGINTANSKREADKEINLHALQVAGKLADGENIGLLAEFVTKRLSFSEGEVKVLDKNGAITISTTEDLQKEIQGDVKFASLLKGVKSSGGGANGGDNSGGAANTKLNSTQRIAEGLKEL